MPLVSKITAARVKSEEGEVPPVMPQLEGEVIKVEDDEANSLRSVLSSVKTGSFGQNFQSLNPVNIVEPPFNLTSPEYHPTSPSYSPTSPSYDSDDDYPPCAVCGGSYHPYECRPPSPPMSPGKRAAEELYDGDKHDFGCDITSRWEGCKCASSGKQFNGRDEAMSSNRVVCFESGPRYYVEYGCGKEGATRTYYDYPLTMRETLMHIAYEIGNGISFRLAPCWTLSLNPISVTYSPTEPDWENVKQYEYVQRVASVLKRRKM